MIGYFLTAADVGYYGIAAGLSKFFWIIPSAIQTITYPATSEYIGTKNHAALQVMIDKSVKYTACILLPIGLGIGFFAEEIITTVFGGDFIHSVPPLLILIVGTVIFGVSKSVGGSITGAGRPDLGMKVCAISAAINIVLNALLIPYYGITGAAIATMVSLSVNTLAGLFFTVKILNVKIDIEWFGKAFVIALLSVFIFKYLAFINLYLIGITILSLYMCATYLFLLAKEDRAYFMQLRSLLSLSFCKF
jgi:O-antigen/teichoic acid export membrane protein